MPNDYRPPRKRVRSDGDSPLDQRTAQQSGAMDARLSDVEISEQFKALDLVGLRSNIQDRERAKDVEKKSLGQTMTGTEALIKLGIAAAAAGFGGDIGKQAGLGLASGTIQGAKQSTAQYNEDRQKQIDDLSGMVDKQQQRIVTLLQSQPGMFLDNEGKNLVAPGEWADLLEIDVPINVESLARVGMRRNSAESMSADAWKMINQGKAAGNREWIANGIAMLAKAHPEMNLTPERQRKMLAVNDVNAFATLTDMFTISSVSKMMKWTVETGGDMFSKEAFDMLTSKPDQAPDNSAAGLKYAAELKARAKLVDHINTGGNFTAWEKDPFGTIEKLFEYDPIGKADLLGSSPMFREGDDMRTEQLKYIYKGLSDSYAMAIVQAGAEGKDTLPLLERMMSEMDYVGKQAMGIVEVATTKQSIDYLGGAFVQRYGALGGFDPQDALMYGTHIMRRVVADMEANGISWEKIPPNKQDDLRDLYMHEEWMQYAGKNPDLVAERVELIEKATKVREEQKVAQATEKQRLFDEPYEARVDVAAPTDTYTPDIDPEAKVNTAVMSDAVSNRNIDVTLERVRNMNENVVLTDEQQAGVDALINLEDLDETERQALIHLPEVQMGIRVSQDVASGRDKRAYTESEIVDLLESEDVDREILERLKGRSEEYQLDLARRDSRVGGAVQRQRQRNSIPQDRLDKIRKLEEAGGFSARQEGRH